MRYASVVRVGRAGDKRMAKTCKIPGCSNACDDGADSCGMHLARAVRGSKNATFAGSLRDGTRTTTINVRCAPDLKRKVKARASKQGISEGRAAEELLRRALDPKACPYHPFCPKKP